MVISQRTCIGCKTKKSKDELVRIIVDLKGNVVLDTEKSSKGRGAYLCKDKSSCLEKAIKRNAFKYVFKKRKIKKIKVTSSAKTTSSHGHGPC